MTMTEAWVEYTGHWLNAGVCGVLLVLTVVSGFAYSMRGFQMTGADLATLEITYQSYLGVLFAAFFVPFLFEIGINELVRALEYPTWRIRFGGVQNGE